MTKAIRVHVSFSTVKILTVLLQFNDYDKKEPARNEPFVHRNYYCTDFPYHLINIYYFN